SELVNSQVDLPDSCGFELTRPRFEKFFARLKARDRAAGRDRAPSLELLLEELSCDVDVALFVRVLHRRAVFPAAVPIDGLRQVNRIFNRAGVKQVLSIRRETQAFDQFLLSAARQ